MTTKFNAYSYFETPIWRQEFPEHVVKTNKVCNKYITQAKKRDKDIWNDVKLGIYDMKIISLHCFANEKGILKQKNI